MAAAGWLRGVAAAPSRPVPGRSPPAPAGRSLVGPGRSRPQVPAVRSRERAGPGRVGQGSTAPRAGAPRPAWANKRELGAGRPRPARLTPGKAPQPPPGAPRWRQRGLPQPSSPRHRPPSTPQTLGHGGGRLAAAPGGLPRGTRDAGASVFEGEKVCLATLTDSHRCRGTKYVTLLGVLSCVRELFAEQS